MTLIPNQFINSVVSIGITGADGKYISIGTGFFAGKKSADGGGIYPYLVTNRHVLKNKREVFIRVVKKDSEDLSIYPVYLFDKEGNSYVKTYSDEKIDIAVVFLNAKAILDLFNMDKVYFLDIDSNILTSDDYMKLGGNLGDPILMLGFPMGIIDQYTNFPICRSGCIARINSKDVKNNKSFLVDIQNFPGSSGSPIFSCPQFVSIVGSEPITRSALIGIIHSYIPYRENLINSQTQELVEIRSENSGLAIANPAEYIVEIIMSDLKEKGFIQREEILQEVCN